MADYLDQLDILFERNRNPSKAGPMKRYMKDKFNFYGIQSPLRRKLQSEFLKKAAKPTNDHISSIVMACFKKEQREWQYFGCDLVCKVSKELDPESITLIRDLICTQSWWDTVDALATNAVGPLIRNFPELKLEMDRWIGSENMWLRRSAIISQLKFGRKTDLKRLSKYISKCAHEKEFFIRKAIGWALREYAKTDAAWVLEFVDSLELSGLTRREALKHLNKSKSR